MAMMVKVTPIRMQIQSRQRLHAIAVEPKSGSSCGNCSTCVSSPSARYIGEFIERVRSVYHTSILKTQYICIDVHVLHSLAWRIFWSVEAMFHESQSAKRLEATARAAETSPFELYHFLQAFLHAAPQIMTQFYVLLREDVFRNYETSKCVKWVWHCVRQCKEYRAFSLVFADLRSVNAYVVFIESLCLVALLSLSLLCLSCFVKLFTMRNVCYAWIRVCVSDEAWCGLVGREHLAC